MKASGIVTSATCPHVRELVEQAYSSIIPEQEKERQLEPFFKMESDGKVSTVIPLFAFEEEDDTSNEATESKEESEGARKNEKGQEDGKGSNNENKESMIDKKEDVASVGERMEDMKLELKKVKVQGRMRRDRRMVKEATMKTRR